MNILRLVPNLVDENMNKDLDVEVTSKEVLNALKSYRKGNILGLDGLFVEFYLAFYDYLKDDLVKVVEESRGSGKVLGDLNSTFIAMIPKH